jgi:hypothetical protein
MYLMFTVRGILWVAFAFCGQIRISGKPKRPYPGLYLHRFDGDSTRTFWIPYRVLPFSARESLAAQGDSYPLIPPQTSHHSLSKAT